MTKTNFSVQSRVWISSEMGPFAGKGKIELLEKIKDCGTLTQAAIEMKMPYRQAWIKIHEMNNAAVIPVVLFKKGGRNHGNTVVTEFGEKVISVFKTLEAELEQFILIQEEKINIPLNEQPQNQDS
jgi:molybdate transport system regulatory protein